MRFFSRREFFKNNSLAALGLLSAGSWLAPGDRRPLSTEIDGNNVPRKVGTLAGMSLEELRDKYRDELFSRFLPNMDRYAIDHENGGVMCNLDVRTGELTNTVKRAWFVGRGLWVYSWLYNNIERNPRYLEIARKSKDLALKVRPGEDHVFWPNQFSADGSERSEPGDIYGSLFVAEGLAEYAIASGEMEYRDLAKKIMFDCLARYDRPDYTYPMAYFGGSSRIEHPRVLGHWMIFLSLSTQMLRHAHDPDLEKLADRCVEMIMDYHINPDHGLTNEYINHDLSRPSEEFAQFSVIGHGLETVAFVMFEAERRRDTALFERAYAAFKKHVDVARDPVYNGYFHAVQHVDEYRWSTGKALWNQEEVLTGTLFVIEHTGDPWAQEHFSRTHHYIYEKFISPGNKFWHNGGNRKMDAPNSGLLEHYHHARQLMYGLRALDRMIERGGEISGVFGRG